MTIFVAHYAFAFAYGLYRKVWKYTSIGKLTSIFKAVTFSIIAVGVVQLLVRGDVLHRALAITWMLHLLLIGVSYLSWRLFRNMLFGKKLLDQKRTMIIGAGQAGTLVARQLLNNKDRGLPPVAFVDDDVKKQGHEIYSIRVVGGTEILFDYVKDNQIEHIIVTIPSLGKQEAAELISVAVDTRIRTQTIPLIEYIMSGKLSATYINDVKIEDLLGRDEVQLDMNKIKAS